MVGGRGHRTALAATAAAVVTAVALAGLLVTNSPPPPRADAPTPPLTISTPSLDAEIRDEPTPTPTNRPRSPIPSRHVAPNPLVLYGRRVTHGVDLYAVEVGGGSRRPTYLGMIEESSGSSHLMKGNGRTFPLVHRGGIALLSRGDKLGDRFLSVEGWIRSAAVSSDNQRVAVASTTADQAGLVTVAPLAAPGRARKVGRLVTGSDENGGELYVFWNSGRSMTLIDICHCDGGSGGATTYSLSLSDSFRDLSFLDDHQPYDPDPIVGSARFVFDAVPNVDCFESEHACDNLLHSLTIADVRRRSLYSVAKQRGLGFASPRISPDGSLVAAAAWQGNSIKVYDVARRRLVAETFLQTRQFLPVEWIDGSRLIAFAQQGEDHQSGRLMEIRFVGGKARIRSEPLASGDGLTYLGWLG